MFFIETVGFIAAFLTTAAFLPQVFKIWKTKDVNSLSLPMYFMVFFGVVLWLFYGFLKDSPSLIVANSITSISTLYILICILKYKKGDS